MEFFEEMAAALEREARRRGVRLEPEVWDALQRPAAKPVAAPSPPAAEIRTSPVRHPVPATEVPAAAEGTPSAPPPAELRNEKTAPPDDWDGLRGVVLSCTRCRLAETRRNVVFGEGDCHARLMFVGEGPGADEDATGRPFVGEAGQLLDKMIAAMQFRREEVYIANVVKCRPPGNRVPADDEAAECLGYLRKQIELVRPEVIVLLGATALRFLLQKDGIRRSRGVWHEYRGIPVMPTYHPAYLLRQATAKREVWNDLKMVMARLGKISA